MRRKVIGNCRHTKSWNNFLRWDEIKTEIFKFLVDKMILAQTTAQVIVTNKGDVCNADSLASCNYEEVKIWLSAVTGCPL